MKAAMSPVASCEGTGQRAIAGSGGRGRHDEGDMKSTGLPSAEEEKLRKDGMSHRSSMRICLVDSQRRPAITYLMGMKVTRTVSDGILDAILRTDQRCRDADGSRRLPQLDTELHRGHIGRRKLPAT